MKFTHVFLKGLFSYNGGKKRLADELTPLFTTFDSHAFIDLCGGSGVVTLSHYAQSLKTDVFCFLRITVPQ